MRRKWHGKTTFCKELIHHLLMHEQKVGVIALEESNKRTLLGLVGTHLSKNLLVDRQQATDDEVLRLRRSVWQQNLLSV